MQRWTDEQLRQAVAAHRNISQTLRAIGLRPVGANYDTVRRRIAALALDTSHWARANSIVLSVDEATLRAAVARSTTVVGCLNQLGHSDTGASRRRLKALIALYGIDTGHFLGQRANAGRRFPQFVQPVARYLVVGGPRIKSSLLRKKLLDEGVFRRECSLCAGRVWRGSPIPLELDHINGDRDDNRLENLRLLCPNCHALTPTYRGRNVGRYDRVRA